MCGARLFAVRVILLQRYKVLPACLPDFGSLPTLIQGARNGRQPAAEPPYADFFAWAEQQPAAARGGGGG